MDCALLVNSILPTLGVPTAMLRGWSAANCCSFSPNNVLCANSRITALVFFSANLTGSIPPAIAQLTELDTLGLYANALTGPLPAALATLARLRTLSLNNNLLVGTIPPSYGALNLTSLYLQDNNLLGPLPLNWSKTAFSVSPQRCNVGPTFCLATCGSFPAGCGGAASLCNGITALTRRIAFNCKLFNRTPICHRRPNTPETTASRYDCTHRRMLHCVRHCCHCWSEVKKEPQEEGQESGGIAVLM